MSKLKLVSVGFSDKKAEDKSCFDCWHGELDDFEVPCDTCNQFSNHEPITDENSGGENDEK